jgi:uncharacterized protein (DUF169 family)
MARTVGSEVTGMPRGNLFNRYGKELEERLQLRTSPIAVKMLQKEKDIPKGAIRPRRDLRAHLALCQGLALSRRDGAMVAMLKEDNWCSIPVVAFGLAAPPRFYLEGHTEYRVRIGSRKAAKNWAKNSPRLQVGKYIGVLSAPLRTAKFEPDLVVIYCNSAQLKCLLDGMKYKNGTLVTSTLEPAGACVQSNVRPLLSGECQVAVPCGGDRKWALAKDDELIFSVPKDKLKDLMFGLRHFYNARDGYPHMTAGMKFEYPLYRKNLKVGKMIGMDFPG